MEYSIEIKKIRHIVFFFLSLFKVDGKANGRGLSVSSII